MKNFKNNGFTLVEITLVLVIVSLLLGYTIAMVPIQQEIKQYRQAKGEMDKIVESLYAFAQVNSYLPCPAWFVAGAPPVTSNGFECRNNNIIAQDCDAPFPPNPLTDSCDVWYGFVPGKTLGINGNYSATTGALLDPWGQPYRYQVTNSNAGGGVTASGLPDFITLNDIRNEVFDAGSLAGGGLAVLAPDLEVCNTDPTVGGAGTELICGGAPLTVINQLPAVIMSTGKNTEGNVATTSWIQRENLDNAINDRIFVLTQRSDVANSEYDDIVKWISPNQLYSKMIEAGQLP